MKLVQFPSDPLIYTTDYYSYMIEILHYLKYKNEHLNLSLQYLKLYI